MDYVFINLLLLCLYFVLQEEQVELDEILAKRQKRGKVTEDKSMDEKSILHSMFFYMYIVILKLMTD